MNCQLISESFSLEVTNLRPDLILRLFINTSQLMYCVQTREELYVRFMIMFSLTVKGAVIKRKLQYGNRKLAKSIFNGKWRNNYDGKIFKAFLGKNQIHFVRKPDK